MLIHFNTKSTKISQNKIVKKRLTLQLCCVFLHYCFICRSGKKGLGTKVYCGKRYTHCKCLQGVYGEIRVHWFQIYGWGLYVTRNPCILKSPHSDFHCNIWSEFNSTGRLRGIPHNKCRKNLIFGDICAKFAGIPCKFQANNIKGIVLYLARLTPRSLAGSQWGCRQRKGFF